MILVFLLEELSMKVFLEGLLPRLLPDGVQFQLIAHEGKADLDRSIPRKLKAWRDPTARFIIVRDQDSSDCVALKAKLVKLCVEAGRGDALVRIACQELEAWILGDLQAVDQVYGTQCAAQQNKTKFRDPDKINKPSQQLAELIPGFGKVGTARALGGKVDVENTRSHSFAQFVSGIRRLITEKGSE